jgi:starvation-inducible DNA-binding protein
MQHPNPDVASKLAQVLADVVTAKFILHGYHWNALGPDFGEMHEFFSTLYEDVSESIDPLAENILKVGFPAPYMLSDYVDLSAIREDRLDGSSTQFMLQSSLRIMERLYDCHLESFKLAESCDLQGLMDFLAARIDMYAKWKWQIKAYLGVR